MKKLVGFILFIELVFAFNAFGQWEACNMGMCGGKINCIATDGNNIYAGTGGRGTFFSSDNGNKWTSKVDGLWNHLIVVLATNKKYVFAGTYGGIYRAKLTDFGITDVLDSPSSPSTFSLFPNPVQDVLNVRMGQAEGMPAKAKVCDIYGHQVAEGALPDGSNDLKIDLSAFPAGTYFCTVQSGSRSETKKFVVLK